KKCWRFLTRPECPRCPSLYRARKISGRLLVFGCPEGCPQRNPCNMGTRATWAVWAGVKSVRFFGGSNETGTDGSAGKAAREGSCRYREIHRLPVENRGIHGS